MNHCFNVQKRQRGLFWGHHVSNPLLEDLESLLISLQPTHTALWHLLSTTPRWTQYHFAILNSAIQWLVAHSENGIHPMASQWNHGSSCPQQLFLIQTVIACFRLMVSAAMLQEAYAVLPGTKTLFCQFLSHPVSKVYSIVYHYFSDGLLFSHTTSRHGQWWCTSRAGCISPINEFPCICDYWHLCQLHGWPWFSGVEFTYWCTSQCMANYCLNDGVLCWMQESL